MGGNALRGVTFLSLNKKVTKEVSLGESAQASLRQFAPSPKNPSLRLGVRKKGILLAERKLANGREGPMV